MVNIRFLLGTLALVGAPGAIAATIRQRDCSFSVPAEAGDTCQSLAASWAIGVDQFTRWNAGVQCGAALVAGKEYCVEWDGPEPVVTTTSSSTASKTTTTPKAPTLSTTSTTTSAAALPTDSMPDIVSNCNKFYKVASGDTCATIESINGITDADFKKWNPYITSTCTNLWLDYNVCVGVPGSTTSKPSTTTNAPAVPTDNMPDIVSNCNKFHKVASGDTCATIESANGITDADFKKWNPYITSTCTNLWLDYNVCVGVPGSTTSKPSMTTTAPAIPTDNMPDIVSNCNKFYKIVSGETCATIESSKGVTDADFKKWNPYINSACTNLWLGYNVCVGVPGSQPITTTKIMTTTTPSGPTPTQSGIVQDCK
jgi:LysM repeat protein